MSVTDRTPPWEGVISHNMVKNFPNLSLAQMSVVNVLSFFLNAFTEFN